jgi:hypothetical protein
MNYYLNPNTQQVEATAYEHSDVLTLFKTREEAEASGMAPAYLAELLKAWVVPNAVRSPNRNQLLRIAELLECLDGIHETVNVPEWEDHTLAEVAGYLDDRGLTVMPFMVKEGNCQGCNETLPNHDPVCALRPGQED